MYNIEKSAITIDAWFKFDINDFKNAAGELGFSWEIVYEKGKTYTISSNSINGLNKDDVTQVLKLLIESYRKVLDDNNNGYNPFSDECVKTMSNYEFIEFVSILELYSNKSIFGLSFVELKAFCAYWNELYSNVILFESVEAVCAHIRKYGHNPYTQDKSEEFSYQNLIDSEKLFFLINGWYALKWNW